MSSIRKNWIPGLVIISLGVLFLLKNLGMVDISIGELIKTYWPVVFIYFGLNQMLFDRDGMADVISGAVILFLGVSFLGRNLDWFVIDLSVFWQLFWPAIIILIGFSFIWGNKVKIKGKGNMAFMGAIEKKHSNWDLEDGSYTALMGGVELDLTRANIPDGETKLELTAVMGGIEIYVPRDVTVICEGMAVLGGHELMGKSTGGIMSSTRAEHIGSKDNKKIIKMYCKAVMGGVSVKIR